MRYKKRPTSKVMLTVVLALVIIFVVWCCAEMHRQFTLEPLAYIAPSVIALGAVAVGVYAWRAKQSDTARLELKRLEMVAELKERYGDNVPDHLLQAMQYPISE